MVTTTKDAPTHTALQTRLDELRVRLHLGGMDAQDKWKALSHDIAAFGREAARASQDAAHRLRERIDALEALLVRD